MKINKPWILFLITILTFSNCLDEIRLNIDNTTPSIVVDGLITDSLMTHTIRLHRSSVIGVGNDNIQEPITGADVLVLDNNNGTFLFTETREGIYIKQFKGEVGKSYTVQIKLKDGTIIKSLAQTLVQAPQIGTITTERKDEAYKNVSGNISIDKRLILKMNTDLRNLTDDVYLRWRAEGEFEFVENYPMALSTKTCYVKNNVDLNNLKIFDSRILADKMIKNEPFINTTLDYRFAYQYCFHIQQLSLSLEEYNYWAAVKSVTEIDGSLFDEPPGTVHGNLINETNPKQRIMGYFSVNGIKSVRFFANPQSLNQIDIEPKCRFRFNTTPSADCLNCLSIDGSTVVRPPYWKP